MSFDDLHGGGHKPLKIDELHFGMWMAGGGKGQDPVISVFATIFIKFSFKYNKIFKMQEGESRTPVPSHK